MTNRDLLELAAKAEGRTLKYMTQHIEGREPEEFIACWNPLTDDGDALRLAVRLGLYVNVYLAPTNKTNVGGAKLLTSEDHNSDPDAATRLAIVRAAAEIGKATP